MAEKTNLAEDQSKEAPAETPAAPKGKAPLLPPIVIKIAVLGGLLVVIGVGALLLVTEVIAPRLGSREAEATAEGSGELAGEHGSSAGESGEKKGAHGDKKGGHATGEIVELGDIVVNPAGTGGRRFLKAAVSIEVKDAKLVHHVQGRTAQVKDILIRALSGRTMEELTDPVTKEEMRESLVAELNEVFEAGTILNLYFTEYVVQ